jgi:hypothetical protein
LEAACRHEQVVLVATGMHRLPALEQRFLGCYLDGKSGRQIAEQFRIPLSDAYRLRALAVDHLRDKVTALCSQRADFQKASIYGKC